MNRLRFACFVLLALALPCSAQEKQNTLTPSQTAEGWLLLFDGETTMGWANPDDSKWTTADGVLSGPKDKAGVIATTTYFLDYELQFEYQSTPKLEGRIIVAYGAEMPGSAGLLKMGPENGWVAATMKVRGGQIVEQSYRTKTSRAGGAAGGVGDARTKGGIAFSGKDIVVRNIKLKPLNARSLFNGKNLSGWKVFLPEKYKSKFTVTEKGELNVKNGSGDIQTEGKFGDFLLQLDCISNGKHLNSGIFFRCKPNEYQNGYEAQIRNQFTPEATQSYVVERYDPKTHKLIEKTKVTSTAFDFGTGSIYRRVPARKEAAKDGAWFTFTIAAQGNHFATWVNGVQQVDWFDNRAPSDNPRTGYRAEAGHISIQGHDPTTDLSFKGFRVVEFK